MATPKTLDQELFAHGRTVRLLASLIFLIATAVSVTVALVVPHRASTKWGVVEYLESEWEKVEEASKAPPATPPSEGRSRFEDLKVTVQTRPSAMIVGEFAVSTAVRQAERIDHLYRVLRYIGIACGVIAASALGIAVKASLRLVDPSNAAETE